jgi:hypothetical protein
MLFPVGKPLVLITEEEMGRLSFADGKCYLKGDKPNTKKVVKGVIQLKILAPSLEIPFLQYR